MVKVKILLIPSGTRELNLFENGGKYSLGGYHTNSTDWRSPKDYTEFNTGSTHELNGNEGIPLGVDNEGTPNLVELGEVKYDDYIFSNRLKVPTSKELKAELKDLKEEDGGKSQRGWEISILLKFAGLTYARAAKNARKESKERPNDAISNRTLDTILGVLANSLEKLRAIEQLELQAEEIKSMSDEEFNLAKDQQEAQQEAELQLMELLLALLQQGALMQEELLMAMLLQAGIDPQQFALMPPELQLKIVALILLLTLLQLPTLSLMAYGGDMNLLQTELQLKYILAIHNYMTSLGRSEDLDALKVYALYAELALKDLMLAIKFALPYFQEYVKQQQEAALYAEGGLMAIESQQEEGLPFNEELQELDMFGNIDNPEDLSTTDLNNTIDLIILYARLNGLRDIVKAGRKAKKGSRDDKEEFVEDSIDDIREIEALRQEEVNLQLLKLDALMLEQQAQELAMLELLTLEEDMQLLAIQLLMMLQQMAQLQAIQADAGTELNLQELLFAKGGNLFPDGGDMNPLIMKALGLVTKEDVAKWLKDNSINNMIDSEGPKWSWNKKFIDAIRKTNPILAHSIDNGNDFGYYKPSQDKATIYSISKGNWKTTDGKGWYGSDDPAFTEATKNMSKELVEALTTDLLAKLMSETDAYKNTSKWLEKPENALLYLNTLINDKDTPLAAIDYAKKFVDNGNWKKDFTYDYGTVFGKDGEGVRFTNPGTYWHSVKEANRGNNAKNFVIKDNGDIEEIITDVPSDYVMVNNYNWADADNDNVYKYFKAPSTQSYGLVEQKDNKTNPVSQNEPLPTPGDLAYKDAMMILAGAGLANLFFPSTNYGAKLGSIPSYSLQYTPELATNFLRLRRVFDPRYGTQEAASALNRQLELASLLSSGNRGAGLAAGLVGLNQYYKALGNLERQGLLFNADLDLKEAQYLSSSIELPNVLAMNQALLFNAALRALTLKYNLDNARYAYAMLSQYELDRDKAISQPLSEIARMRYLQGQNADLRALAQWMAKYGYATPGLRISEV